MITLVFNYQDYNPSVKLNVGRIIVRFVALLSPISHQDVIFPFPRALLPSPKGEKKTLMSMSTMDNFCNKVST